MRVNFLTAVAVAALPVALSLEHVVKRDVQSGGKCGSTQGNAVCAEGLCCSEEGACGTGRTFCSSPACQLNFGPACDGNGSPRGKDTSAVRRPPLGDIPYGTVISRCTLPGKIALTFDDGPNKFTSELLDILKKSNAKATFFITAANGGKGQIQDESAGLRDVVKRMHSEGHQIASHSWSHEKFVAISAQQRRDQIVKNEIALTDILGFFPTYLRLPYSSWDDQVLGELKKFGYHNIDYNLDTRDTEQPDGDFQLSRDTFSSAVSAKSPADSSFIVIAHDIQEKTVRGFTQFMIDQALKYKYELVTVGECLDDPSNNWYRDPVSGEQFGGPPPKKEKPQVAAPSGAPSGVVSTSASASGARSSSTGPTSASTSSSGLSSPSGSGPKEGATGAAGSTPAGDVAATGAPKSTSDAERSIPGLARGMVLGYFVLFIFA